MYVYIYIYICQGAGDRVLDVEQLMYHFLLGQMSKFAEELGIKFRAADVYEGGLRYEDEAVLEEA